MLLHFNGPCFWSSIAAVPLYPNLWHFPQGRRFKQWTGDDSKALMKVYLPAIEGHVPSGMVHAISAFLDFCYLARRNSLNESALNSLDRALERFHHHRRIFQELGVCEDGPKGFSLPWQHSMTHYRHLIQEFGVPNGLCSSITESKHIKAVKKPWWRSNRFQALGQMLITNQRLDKLAATRVDFESRCMLKGSVVSSAVQEVGHQCSEHSSSDKDSDGGNGPDDDEIQMQDGPCVLNFVRLAKTPGIMVLLYCDFPHLILPFYVVQHGNYLVI